MEGSCRSTEEFGDMEMGYVVAVLEIGVCFQQLRLGLLGQGQFSQGHFG